MAPLPDPQARLSHDFRRALDAAFAVEARLHPERLALSFRGDEWTYGELESLSGKLASLLADAGVKPGDVVAVISDRNATLVCALLAIVRAGATFAILDSGYPQSRVDTLLGMVEPAHVLVAGQGGRPTGTTSVTLLPTDLSSLRQSLSSQQAAVPTPRFDGIAYLSFTSGSTGKPKCIATGHAPLPHFIDWHRRTHELTERDSFMLSSGLSHDPLLRDIFTPLSLGAHLHIPEQRVLTDPSALFDFVSSARISVMHLTPQLGRVLVAGSNGRQLPSLRRLAWGGDILTKDLVARFTAVAPQARHVNFYGTTETPQAMGFYQVPIPLDAERIPIGKGIDDVQLLVLDQNNRLAAVGEIGELVVRTPYLSMGYHRDPGATQSRYITNPYTGDPADLCYRTGDRACFLPDGSVEFRGRSDDQVKIRGYRVELSEVAAVLRGVPGLREIQVLPRRRDAGDLQIVAFVCPTPGASLRADDLAAHAQKTMPVYMQPARYVVLPDLPRLTNGKIDRQALLNLPLPSVDVGADEEPCSPREAQLAKLWAELLGLPRVSIHESFYSLGGDSLAALEVMLGMKSLGIGEDSCRLLLQGKTIAEIVNGTTRSVGSSGDKLEQARITLNLLRGIIVLAVLLDHWFNPIAARLPTLKPYRQYLGALFNWPTPGFAIVFGITIGFVYHQIFQSNPDRLRQMCKRGAAFVGFGSIMHLLVFAGVDAVDGRVDWFWLSHSAMHYYLFAMLSVPLWLRIIGRSGPVFLRASLLAAAFLALNRVLQALFPDLNISFALGKYAYFNLSAGVLMGFLMGYALKLRQEAPKWYVPLGASISFAGLLTCRLTGQWQSSFVDSYDVEIWKWALYVGLTMISLSALQLVAKRAIHAGPKLRKTTHLLAAIGQLAFPLFVLDFVSRKAMNLFDILGAHPAIHPIASLLLFSLGAVVMVRKTYGLFYAQDPELSLNLTLRPTH